MRVGVVRKTLHHAKGVAYRTAKIPPVLERLEQLRKRRQIDANAQFVAKFVAETDVVSPRCLVTTVIPTFHRPALLLRAVQSALDQTVTDHHVVVVDHGGGDLPEMPPSPRLHIVELPSQTGNIGVPRNVGIDISDSPYLAFLDDDNTWEPNHLETCIAVLEAGADLCYSAYLVVDAGGRVIRSRGRPFSRWALRGGNYVDTNTIVMRRDPEARMSVMPRRRASWRREDWELVYRYSKNHRVAYSPVPTVRYFENPDSYFSTWPH